MTRVGAILVLCACGRVDFDPRSDARGGTGGDGGGDGVPLDCPNVGDVCADGTIYAGITPDGNVRMYTEATTTNDNTPWSFGTGGPPVMAVLTGMTNEVTGAANTAALSLGGPFQDADSGAPGVQGHDAANYCTDLVANGHTDWYLPAYQEVQVMVAGAAAIGGFVNDEYWSSNEDMDCPTDCAMAAMFPSGQQSSFRNKYDYRALRCVRK